MSGSAPWATVGAWTDERTALLRKFWQDGLSASQIAIRLGGGVSRNAVIGKACRLKLTPRSPAARKEVFKDAMDRRYGTGPRVREIKAERSTGHTRPQPWTPERLERLTILWNVGHTGKEIGEALDVSAYNVIACARRIGLKRSQEASRAASAVAVRGALGVGPQAAASLTPESYNPIAWAPLPNSQPRPWITRAFGECAFPLPGDGDETLSCCVKTKRGSNYCRSHQEMMFRPGPEKPKRQDHALGRDMRRVA